MKLPEKLCRRVVTGASMAAGIALSTPAAFAIGGTPLALPPWAPRTIVQPLGRLGPLVEIVIERLLVIDRVAAWKFGSGEPVDATKREQQELDAGRAHASRLGVEPDAAVAFLQDQIEASKVVQRGLFARWAEHPEQVSAAHPDICRMRGQIDHLNAELLQELTSTQDLRSTFAGCTVHLPLATQSGAILNRLDTLHRQALRTAMRTGCVTPWTEDPPTRGGGEAFRDGHQRRVRGSQDASASA